MKYLVRWFVNDFRACTHTIGQVAVRTATRNMSNWSWLGCTNWRLVVHCCWSWSSCCIATAAAADAPMRQQGGKEANGNASLTRFPGWCFSVSVDGFPQRSISQWLTTLIVRLSYWLLLGWLVQRFIGHLFDLSGSLGDVLGFFFQRSWGLWNESLEV